MPYEEIDVFQIRFLLHSRWIYQYRHIHIDYGLATNGHDDKSETGLFNHQGGKALAAVGCKGYTVFPLISAPPLF